VSVICSPDARYIYIGQRGINRFELATHQQMRLLEHSAEGNFVHNLAFSPDGQRLAFSSDQQILHIMPADGGKPQEVFHILADRGFARRTLAWSPNGQALIIGTCAKHDPAGPVTLWHVPLSRKEPKELGIQMVRIRHVRVHADGQQIMFAALAGARCFEVWAIDNVLAMLNSRE
jgi:WD40 repeat protein